MTTPTDERSTLVHQRAGQPPAERKPAEPPTRAAWLLRSGWPPALLTVVVVVAVLRLYGVGPGTTAAFGGYLVACVALPGTLVWRAVDRGRRWFGFDVAAGTAVGYAGETALYILCRAADMPLLVLCWPVGTVLLFVAVPRLRQHFRAGPAHTRPPVWWSWCMAGVVLVAMLWSVRFFRWFGLTWPGYADADIDMPYHLALVGEAKHHMPMEIPWLAGEPLHYHWFGYAQMAATSWVTGVEPQVLLLRLFALPMLAAFVVLVGALAVRLLTSWWTGVAAPVFTLFVLAPNPYGWEFLPRYTSFGFSAVDDGSVLRLTVWTGPTQTFAALLAVPVVILLVDLLRDPTGRARWVLFGAMLAVLAGAKATYLPLLFAGVVAVAVVAAVRTRRLPGPALVAVGLVGAVGLAAHAVLFNGTTQGLAFAPLKNLNLFGVMSSGILEGPERLRPLVVVALGVFCWAWIWFGVSGLVRRRALLEPATVLLLGIGLAGIGATALLGQAGDSQRFFLEGARPYLSVAAVAGLAAVLRLDRFRRARMLALVGAAVAGVVVVVLVRAVDGGTRPAFGMPARATAVTVVWPYAALALAAVAAAVGLALTRRRLPALDGVRHALLIALLAGVGLATTAQNYAWIARDVAAHGWRGDDIRRPQLDDNMPDPIVTEGTVEAGRWVRAHSGPDDVVATNAHCLPSRFPTCLNLHFSVAAYTERRVLVEGWGFTDRAHRAARRSGTNMGFVPYWDTATLAANDAVFSSPTDANATTLRDRYRVRWLFVDETVPVGGGLDQVAAFRFRSGRIAVYELTRP